MVGEVHTSSYVVHFGLGPSFRVARLLGHGRLFGCRAP